MCGKNLGALFVLSISLVSVHSNAIIQDPNCHRECTKQFDPVCGKYGNHRQIFMNECMFKVKMCADDKDWSAVEMSECFKLPNIEIKKIKNIEDEELLCPMACTFIYDPVCGFDGERFHLFENRCVMDAASCYLDNIGEWKESKMMDCMRREQLS